MIYKCLLAYALYLVPLSVIAQPAKDGIVVKKDGDCTIISTYKNGNLDGLYFETVRQKDTMVSGNYCKGKKCGDWKEFRHRMLYTVSGYDSKGLLSLKKCTRMVNSSWNAITAMES